MEWNTPFGVNFPYAISSETKAAIFAVRVIAGGVSIIDKLQILTRAGAALDRGQAALRVLKLVAV